MEQVLNLESFDVELLERILICFNETRNEAERSKAQQVLMKLRQHPQAWRKVEAIVEQGQSPHTKFFGLQILEDLIKFRWLELPPETRTGIRGYLIKLITKVASSSESLAKQRLFASKLNLQIVEVAKHDWPGQWPTFIAELVQSAKNSESICENNMNILKLLNEEIFDYSAGKMTRAKIDHLKNTLAKEFQLIFKLCFMVLSKAKKPSLLLMTLQTLLGFLNWIPLAYIFETALVPLLVSKYFPPPPSRVLTLQCLTEIAALSLGSKYASFFVKLFSNFMTELAKIIPRGANLSAGYRKAGENDRKFVHFLILFLTTMFKTHLEALEELGEKEFILRAHELIAMATQIDDDSIFNICLEYWHGFAETLYHHSALSRQGSSLASSSSDPLLLVNSLSEEDEDEFGDSTREAPTLHNTSRCQAYSEILGRVRGVLVSRMPKPEEVLIVEDEYGKIVREQTTDTVALGLYKSMRLVLIYLTHLDPEHTQNLIVERLKKVCAEERWTYDSLNTLCWSIGSVSGALNEQDEKHFLVTTIKALLRLVGTTQLKDAKAVIASNIMYIVGQYPRFLRAHWRFLRTVVKKLFEFMHEKHPGVQDMACDTFLKIARRCRRKFVVPQEEEHQPFVEVILENLPSIIRELKSSQVQVFYEAVASMIQAHPEPRKKVQLIAGLMTLPNRTWIHTIQRVKSDQEYFRAIDTANIISTVLKTNERVCSAVGSAFSPQMQKLFFDMLGVFKGYNSFVSDSVGSRGPECLETAELRAIRATKKDVLRLIETFVEKAEDFNARTFLPPILESVLGDYSRVHPDARDAGVLSLFAAIINKLQGAMTAHAPDVFLAVFEPTLVLIKKNYQDYPDHRLHFFTLLSAIVSHCFPAVFKIPQKYFTLIIDSVVWGCKHTLRPVSELGHKLLLDLWRKMAKTPAASHFYKTFYIRLFAEVFRVLTDRSHKFAFAHQASILQVMVIAVESGQVAQPLWDPSKMSDPNMNNKLYLRQYLLNLISKHFQNVGPNQVKKFIIGLFSHARELPAFKTHLRDFLVKLQEFSPDSNEDLHLLYHEENEAAEKQREKQERERMKKIPGLIAPAILEDSITDG